MCASIDSPIVADRSRDSPICWWIRAAISALVSVPAVIVFLPLLKRQPKPVPGRPPPSRVPNLFVTKAKKSAKLKRMDGEVDATSAVRQIGRAHVCTQVTNAHLVCRILLEKKNVNTTPTHHHQPHNKYHYQCINT